MFSNVCVCVHVLALREGRREGREEIEWMLREGREREREGELKRGRRD